MARYSVSSMFFHEYNIEEIFGFVKSAGCTSIEFWLETPDFWLDELPADKLKKIIDKYGSLKPITVHAPVLDLNPCSVNPDVAEISIRTAEKSINISEYIDAEVLTVHPGRRTAKRPPDERDFKRLNRYIRRLETASEGKKVKVAIENMQPKINGLLCNPESLYKLLKKEEWLYFTFDIGHALSVSNEEAIRYIDLLIDRIENVHVSASSNGIAHLPSKNNNNVGEIISCLFDYGYKKHLTIEIEDLNFEKKLSSLEKINLLKKEIEYIKKWIN
ncbi:sugar phosphate isomerase/epimerase [Methanoplanus sp. FWC-SCC4]|uniref:Sugar phosphate isomerase/epimerase n=1 Tax=Methanochimaera problematica TaxID=2609417 RepID=A0AA97FE37_9EURY|nr:sugar phosphate isomerase/epimerase family protein [Methanoplanus sp. FWC-SCC4]WOF15771.1 sugar phosphate isomerase/epimerase [Methanoplanus sp. FWC-SCC4]